MTTFTPPPLGSSRPKSGIPDVLFLIVFIAGIVYKGIGLIGSALGAVLIYRGNMETALQQDIMSDSQSYLSHMKVTVPIIIFCIALGIVGLIFLLRRRKLGLILVVISTIGILAIDISSLFMVGESLNSGAAAAIATGTMIIKHFFNIVIIVFGYLAIRQKWAK